MRLQRHARTLHALADRWSSATPSTSVPLSPYAGAEDLNDPAALQLEGVLFMEGEGKPAELAYLIRDLRAIADDFADTGERLAKAMQASWDIAAALVDIAGSKISSATGTGLSPTTGWRQTRARSSRGISPCCGHPRQGRLHAGRAGGRPRRATALGEVAPLSRRDHQSGCRPVQRLRWSRQRQRAPVASLPRTSSSDRRVESISRCLGTQRGA